LVFRPESVVQLSLDELAVQAGVLGFTPEAQALIIALYIAMDSFGTACNVTGDGALAVIIDRLHSKAKKEAAH